MVKSENMPWLGKENIFPRTGEEGSDNFAYSCEQVEIIEREARKDAICKAIRQLVLDDKIDDDDDFIHAVFAVAQVGCSL